MVAIADVLAKVVLEAGKTPEPYITSGDYAEMVTAAARALHHALTNADLRVVRNTAFSALALHVEVEHGARVHRTDWETVGAWMADVTGQEVRDAIAATCAGLRAGSEALR